MYKVFNKYAVYVGNESIVVSQDHGVYHHEHDAPPQEGCVLKVFEDWRHQNDIAVLKVLEQTDTKVVFLDNDFVEYTWEASL